MTKIAVMNDYQNVSQEMTDWGVLTRTPRLRCSRRRWRRTWSRA